MSHFFSLRILTFLLILSIYLNRKFVFPMNCFEPIPSLFDQIGGKWNLSLQGLYNGEYTKENYLPFHFLFLPDPSLNDSEIFQLLISESFLPLSFLRVSQIRVYLNLWLDLPPYFQFPKNLRTRSFSFLPLNLCCSLVRSRS